MSDENNVAAVAPTTDTGGANPASADTSQNASPATTGNAGSQPAPGTNDQGSLTSGDPNVQTKTDPASPNAGNSPAQPAEPAKPVDWQQRHQVLEKRHRDLQSWHDKRYQQTQGEVQKLQQQLQDQIRWRQEQERKATLQPWDRAHPEGAKFNGLLERAKAMHRQLEATKRMAPEVQQAAQEAIMAGATPEEHEALAKFREAGTAFQHEFFMTQGDNMVQKFAQVARQVFQEQQEQIAGKQQVAQDFSNPVVKTLLENPTYRTYLDQQLKAGLPYEAGMEMLKLKAANDIMYERLTGSQKAQAAAQEQSRLAKGRAAQTVNPDPAAVPVDPYTLAVKEAKARGVSTDSPAFIKIYNRIAGVG